MTIKPIETIYKGYRFRSRLEARWAVFFDNLQIPYKYEIEGFELDGIKYLPDFWLPTIKSWIEIKPVGWQYSELCDKLSYKDGGVWVLNIFGDPYLDAYGIAPYKNGVENVDTDNPYVFATDRRDKGVLWIENGYVWICFNPKTDHERFPVRDSSEINRSHIPRRLISLTVKLTNLDKLISIFSILTSLTNSINSSDHLAVG